jgi:hypothetical protein
MAETISYQLAIAKTPGEKARVTRKINAIAEQAARHGKNPTMVKSGFKAGAERLRRKMAEAKEAAKVAKTTAKAADASKAAEPYESAQKAPEPVEGIENLLRDAVIVSSKRI